MATVWIRSRRKRLIFSTKKEGVEIEGKWRLGRLEVVEKETRELHNLRLSEAGVPTEVVRQMLGHASFRSTQEYASHLRLSAEAAKRVSRSKPPPIATKKNETVAPGGGKETKSPGRWKFGGAGHILEYPDTLDAEAHPYVTKKRVVFYGSALNGIAETRGAVAIWTLPSLVAFDLSLKQAVRLLITV